MHGRGVLLAVAALALLAYVLWEVTDGGELAVIVTPEPVAPNGAPASARPSVPTYDGGRTTIPPKIAPEAVARIRARKGVA
jgi:hypothetical protein